VTDKARMPLGRETVLRYASLYGQRVVGKQDQVDEAELRTWFVQHRFLDRHHFLKLGRWKSPRPIRWYEQNDADTVEVITRAAIASTDERRKMDLLRQLRGVDYRVASTILHFADPDRYMILDVRAKWSLGWDDRRDSVELWIDYTHHVCALARLLNIPLRTLDMALWEFSKQNQPRSKTNQPPPRDQDALPDELARLRAEIETLKNAAGVRALTTEPANTSVSSVPPITRVPRNEHEVRRLLAERPGAWEYLYFTSIVHAEMQVLDPNFGTTRSTMLGVLRPDLEERRQQWSISSEQSRSLNIS